MKNFNEILHSLTESKSIIFNTIRKWECLSLPKENEHNEESHINEEFNNFKINFFEEFNNSKRSFFREIKTFKEDVLKLHKTTPENTENQEHIITLLHNDITFLKKNSYNKKIKLSIL